MNYPILFLSLAFILGSIILYSLGAFLLILNTYNQESLRLDAYLCKNNSEPYRCI
jgi:Na+/phosphate symporter